MRVLEPLLGGVVVLCVLGVGAWYAHAQPAAGRVGVTAGPHIMITPDDVQWSPGPPVLGAGTFVATIEGDPAAPNALFTMRLKVPDGWRIAPHFHPADEHVTVLQGTFHMGMGDRYDAASMRALSAGSFAVMPQGEHHFARAEGETIIQLHGVGPWGVTFVNPRDDPRNRRPVKRPAKRPAKAAAPR